MEFQEWKRKSLIDLFNIGVMRSPQHTAVVFDDGQLSSSLTYTQLLVASQALSVDLRCNHKCEREVVGVVVKPGFLLPTALLGILDVPAAFYTLNVKLSAPARIKNIFERLAIRVILTDSEELEGELKEKIFRGCSLTVRHLKLLNRQLSILTLDDVVSCLKNKDDLSRFDLAYAITTSGTTGIPKIVKVPHQCIVPNILHISQIYCLTGADVVLQASPMTFDPSIVEIFTTFFSGATLLLIPDSLKQQPRDLASFAAKKHKITVLQATPSLVSSIAGCGVLPSSLLSAKSSLRLLVFGGESCPNGRVLESWREPGNCTRFINLYGITEVSSWATFYELTEEDIQSHMEDVPLGSTLLGTELEIRDIDDDSVGQLWIGGDDRICLINDETQASGRCMRFSGDYVRKTLTGALHYVGRKDDMVKRNGRRLHLHEIEKIISRANHVNRCVAVYERNRLILFVQPLLKELNQNAARRRLSEKETLEENPRISRQFSMSDFDFSTKSVTDEKAQTSFTVSRKSGNDETKAVIEKRLLATINKLFDDWLPYYSHPDDVIFIWDMPLTSHGKVDKRRLIDLHSKREEFIPSVPHFRTKDEISYQLTQFWKNYITSDVPETKSFVESGGNSVMALSMTEDIRCLFHINSTLLLDKVLHGTLQTVIEYVTSFYQWPSKSAKLDEKHDADSTHVPAENISMTERRNSPWPLSYRNSDLLNLESGNRKHSSLPALPPSKRIRKANIKDGKQIRKDNIKDFTNDSSHRNILDCSTRNESVGIDNAAVLSIQRGSCSVCYKDFAPSDASSTLSGNEVAEETLEMEFCWKFDTGKCVDASPLIVLLKNGEKIVYIGSHSHRFVALNAESGALVWEVTLGDRIESSACLSPCTRYIIVGCYDGKVYFLERLTGKLHWTFQTGSQVKSSPCINARSGLVYIGSHDCQLYALSAQMRSCIWKIDLGGSSIFSSALLNLVTYEVVVATLRGRLVSLHPDTGDLLWQFDAGKPIFSSVAYTGCLHLVGCVDGEVYCIGRQGKKIWSYLTGGAVFSSPCVSDVVLSKHSPPQAPITNEPHKSRHASQGLVRKNSSPSLSTLGNKTIGDDPNIPHQFVDGDSFEENPSEEVPRKLITIGSHDSKVYCLFTDNGHLLWSRTLDSEVYSTPFSFSLRQSSVIKSISSRSDLTPFSSEVTDLVSVCSAKGVLYVLCSASGNVVGKFQFPGEIFSSPCVLGDRLIVGCRDNFVYCIKLFHKAL